MNRMSILWIKLVLNTYVSMDAKIASSSETETPIDADTKEIILALDPLNIII